MIEFPMKVVCSECGSQLEEETYIYEGETHISVLPCLKCDPIERDLKAGKLHVECGVCGNYMKTAHVRENQYGEPVIVSEACGYCQGGTPLYQFHGMGMGPSKVVVIGRHKGREHSEVHIEVAMDKFFESVRAIEQKMESENHEDTPQVSTPAD